MSKKLFLNIISILLIIVFFIFQNNFISTRVIDYYSKGLPQAFEGLTIVQISDLHNKEFGKNQKRLIKELKKTQADLIFITGDLIDRRQFNLSIALSFVEKAAEIAPIYYVSGNHEAWSLKYDEIKNELDKLNVTVLDNHKTVITIEGADIEILGIKDPAFYENQVDQYYINFEISKNLEILSDSDNFKILLSHRPELFDLYSQANIDLIFSGHAHGGQIRLPFIGGLFAPNQGLFPQYTSGSYKKVNSTLIVSRGLGNSIFPLRIFNTPEIVKVVLHKDN